MEKTQLNSRKMNVGMSPPSSEVDVKPEILPLPISISTTPSQVYSDFMYLDSSDSLPKLHTDSSCSEHVLSPEREVQSEPKLSDWEKTALDLQFNYMDAIPDVGDNGLLGSQFQGCYEMSPLQDIFMYLQKPF